MGDKPAEIGEWRERRCEKGRIKNGPARHSAGQDNELLQINW
jgi:hypothetical protein